MVDYRGLNEITPPMSAAMLDMLELQYELESKAAKWSWSTGEVPEDWRKANVTPVFKKGRKKDPGNYRPVSFISTPGKVMEQLILGVFNKLLVAKKVWWVDPG
ncbi:mitochondrial enolase superfamily member 1 [Grus japonensis]|uniref:Mitochondrial enolase superfamily member 1 n=1 Tax=Grus japonensis TaxID=30415 RepID=A0ABC9W2A3_GRUJA